MDGGVSGEAMKRDILIASGYFGMVGGILADHFVIRDSWPAFVLVVVGVIAVGALHVHRAQERQREKHQTHWTL